MYFSSFTFFCLINCVVFLRSWGYNAHYKPELERSMKKVLYADRKRKYFMKDDYLHKNTL